MINRSGNYLNSLSVRLSVVGALAAGRTKTSKNIVLSLRNLWASQIFRSARHIKRGPLPSNTTGLVRYFLSKAHTRTECRQRRSPANEPNNQTVAATPNRTRRFGEEPQHPAAPAQIGDCCFCNKHEQRPSACESAVSACSIYRPVRCTNATTTGRDETLRRLTLSTARQSHICSPTS